MKLSRFVTKYELNNYVAYYHSLIMKPVYLTYDEAALLERDIKDNSPLSLDSSTVELLTRYSIVVANDKDDDTLLDKARSIIPMPYVSVAYFVLTEQCNLACRYCFLGNADSSRQKITNYPMSKDIADAALSFFARQTKHKLSEFHDEKEIIFYGGEPLLNFDTLRHVVNRCNEYQDAGVIGKKVRFSMVTNGILLNPENITLLIKHDVNVAISIDGAGAVANSDRIDKNYNPIYSTLLQRLSLAKDMGLDFSLSVTLTENTINDMASLLCLLDAFKIDSLCFNILLNAPNYKLNDLYYKKATDFIIEFYRSTKNRGIYEERFARKLNAFCKSRLYFSDCAATSGNQIVITPDGRVGICHGCMENREYFIGDVFDTSLNMAETREIIEWSRLSPVLREECQLCPALGICGGGCPINAQRALYNGTIHDLDRTCCVHSKSILKFLINELLRLIVK